MYGVADVFVRVQFSRSYQIGVETIIGEEIADCTDSSVPAGNNYSKSVVKRLFDISIALTGVILISPLLVLSIAVNTVFTRGRPIYIQLRVGRDGELFEVYKLRTMTITKNPENWSEQTVRGDDRVTYVGKILRSTYIDELPQLINVLSGKMSIVGPRPETPKITSEITRLNPRFQERLTVKPGMTGLAQLFFRKPANRKDLWRRYYYDRQYIKHCSFRMDMRLCLRTVYAMLRYKGT